MSINNKEKSTKYGTILLILSLVLFPVTNNNSVIFNSLFTLAIIFIIYDYVKAPKNANLLVNYITIFILSFLLFLLLFLSIFTDGNGSCFDDDYYGRDNSGIVDGGRYGRRGSYQDNSQNNDN